MKVSAEGGSAGGIVNAEIGDSGDVFKKACAEGADRLETVAGMGEGLFGAERGGVRFFEGGGADKFKARLL